jgi:hypothetical protein
MFISAGTVRDGTAGFAQETVKPSRTALPERLGHLGRRSGSSGSSEDRDHDIDDRILSGH